MCEKFQTNQRTFFSRKKVPITHKEFDFFFQKFQLEVGIFSDSKHFSHIFQIVAHLSYLNFISVDLKKNRRTFLDHLGHAIGHAIGHVIGHAIGHVICHAIGHAFGHAIGHAFLI